MPFKPFGPGKRGRYSEEELAAIHERRRQVAELKASGKTVVEVMEITGRTRRQVEKDYYRPAYNDRENRRARQARQKVELGTPTQQLRAMRRIFAGKEARTEAEKALAGMLKDERTRFMELFAKLEGEWRRSQKEPVDRRVKATKEDEASTKGVEATREWLERHFKDEWEALKTGLRGVSDDMSSVQEGGGDDVEQAGEDRQGDGTMRAMS